MAQFPATNSAQRVGGGKPNYNKVPLKPGHSLVNWVQLMRSGKDLRRTGERFLSITPEELAKHNTVNDAWMSIRGMVYNVSEYMEYHPGGAEELMKGVGKDATALFDEIHRWVNYQNMLKECLIGKLVPSEKPIAKKSNFLTPGIGNVLSLPSLDRPSSSDLKLNSNISSSVPSISIIKSEASNSYPIISWFDWYQTDMQITFVVYSKNESILEEHVICQSQNGEVNLNVIVGEKIMCVRTQISSKLSDSFKIKISKNGKVEVTLLKAGNDQSKSSIEFLKNHGQIVDLNIEKYLLFAPCILTKVDKINHDSFLYEFDPPFNFHMSVPMGCHVYFKFKYDNEFQIRPYTPVIDPTKKAQNTGSRKFCFIIKHYENGTTTQLIKNLKVNDSCQISSYSGDIQIEKKLRDKTRILLLAAGTGITPMIKVLQYLLDCKQNVKILLLFFNKTSEDILWLEKLTAVSNNNECFKFINVLSNPDSAWQGLTGRVNKDMLQDIIAENFSDKPYSFVCGPIRFNQTAKEALLSCNCNEIFVFS